MRCQRRYPVRLFRNEGDAITRADHKSATLKHIGIMPPHPVSQRGKRDAHLPHLQYRGTTGYLLKPPAVLETRHPVPVVQLVKPYPVALHLLRRAMAQQHLRTGSHKRKIVHQDIGNQLHSRSITRGIALRAQWVVRIERLPASGLRPYWRTAMIHRTRRLTCATLAATSLTLSSVAHAALQPGDAAPPFRAQAALAGQPFEFDLAAALKKGPVVLYFFPKAFTSGCTVEAHAFAEATPRFRQLGASVIGMSHDQIDTLRKFSTEACRSQFAVASDPRAETIKAYDAASIIPGMASRISYVIGKDGRIAFTHEGMNPKKHVEETLKAVERLQGQR